MCWTFLRVRLLMQLLLCSSHDIRDSEVDEMSESEISIEKLFDKWVIYVRGLILFIEGSMYLQMSLES